MKHESHELTARPYVIGFVASLMFTITAYICVDHHLFDRATLIVIITVLAMAQFLTQLVYFLHLGWETKPYWKRWVFLFMVIVVSIFVLGTIWIMNNLNYHMSLQQMYQYINNQSDGL